MCAHDFGAKSAFENTNINKRLTRFELISQLCLQLTFFTFTVVINNVTKYIHFNHQI